VTAGEDQTEPIVFHGLLLCPFDAHPFTRELGFLLLRLLRSQRGPLFFEQACAAQASDGLVTGGADQPGPRVVGQAVGRPLNQSRLQRHGPRVFREIDVAQQANQRGEDSPSLFAEDARDRVALDVHGIGAEHTGPARLRRAAGAGSTAA